LGLFHCSHFLHCVCYALAHVFIYPLFLSHINRHIIPSLSNTGHLGVTVPGNSVNDSSEDEQQAAAADPVSPKKKRRKTTSLSPTRNDACKNMRTVYIPILSTIGLFGTILERTEGFIISNEMDDRLLFTLSAAALSTLSIDASSFVRSDTTSLASLVQVSSMDVLVSIFRRYPRHRSIIIEDLFPLMLKLPTSKRSLRTFLVKKMSGSKASEASKVKAEPVASSSAVIGDHECIQPISALVLLFVQACVQMPM
jgi:cohesin loading factor subunit SCC2